MKTWILLLVLSAPAAMAVECRCDVFALPPLTASHNLPPHDLGGFSGVEQATKMGDPALCRQDCRLGAMKEYEQAFLKERLRPWVDQLVADGSAGRNCTGPTTFKIPVRVRASLDARSVGIAHQDMVFLHQSYDCR